MLLRSGRVAKAAMIGDDMYAAAPEQAPAPDASPPVTTRGGLTKMLGQQLSIGQTTAAAAAPQQKTAMTDEKPISRKPRGTREGASAGAASIAAASMLSSFAPSPKEVVSPRLRLPLTLLPGEELPLRRVLEGDPPLGAPELIMHRIHAEPLIVRVANFLSEAEIQQILNAVNRTPSVSSNSSSAASSSSASSAPPPPSSATPPWERYKPYLPALNADAESPRATMSKSCLRGAVQIHGLLDTIARRVARVTQAPVGCISSLREVLRYEPGQEFMLHKDDKEFPTPPRQWRLLTALIYLRLEHPEETGGATVFPSLQPSSRSFSYRSPCVAGTLLLFRNCLPGSNALDPRTEHFAEPTNKGAKFVLQCYVAEKEGKDGHWD